MIPAFNAEPYIKRCLNSVLAQTVYDYEVIVVDDGSIDATAAICQNYAKIDGKIRFVCQSHKGVAHTRNHLLDLAQGEWITFVDSDDYVSKDFLEKFLIQIKDAPSVDLFISRLCQVKNGRRKSSSPFKGSKKQYYEALLGKDYAKADSGLCGKVIRHSSIEQHHVRCLEHFSLGEDLYFLVVLLHYIDSIVNIDAQVYFYNLENASSITHSSQYMEEEFICFQEIIRFIQSHPDAHQYNNAINQGKMWIRHNRYLYVIRSTNSNLSPFVYDDVYYKGLAPINKLRLFLINHRLSFLLRTVNRICDKMFRK